MRDDTEGHEFDEFADEAELPFGKNRKPQYPVAEERRHLSEAEKKIVRDRQGGKCAGCSIVPKRWCYDHKDPRWRGQTPQSDLDNWQGFADPKECSCHAEKTAVEAGERAEMNRKRDLTSQYARRKKHGPTIKKPPGYVSTLSKDHPRYRS